MRKRLSAAGLLLLLLSLGIKLTGSTTQKIQFEEDDLVAKNKTFIRRLPSSIQEKISKLNSNRPEGPAFAITDRESGSSHYIEDEQPLPSEITPATDTSWNVSRRTSSVRGQNPSKETASSDILSSPLYTNPFLFDSGGSGVLKEANDSENSEGTRNPMIPVCSVSVNGGSFQGPVNIELTCSTASSIKYCISENTCCDPEQGTVYTGAFQLGEASKSICLSFAGTSFQDQTISETVEAFYHFDPELPHLEVLQNKVHIQTTQLNTSMTLSSNDFGSSHHSVGVINLKTHDPAGLDCSDIATNFSTLGLPDPKYILPEMNVTTLSPATQMELFLKGSDLIYGENNLTAYVKSVLYSFPQYACSTSKLKLEDFNYIQNLPMEIITSHDSAELFGGFTSLSTKDENTDIYRGPANELGDIPTQELRVGLISIFFDK